MEKSPEKQVQKKSKKSVKFLGTNSSSSDEEESDKKPLLSKISLSSIQKRFVIKVPFSFF
jgi:hypothetical protein